jgi:transcriptional regulator with XRE-family HTH domain
MSQTTSGRGRSAKRSLRAEDPELMRLKMELVAAREHGEGGALSRMLVAHPRHVAALAEFAAALVATSGYERETLTAETMAVAARAEARALATVFPVTAPVAASESARSASGGFGALAAASLKALRRARGVSLSAAARRLGLGLDVLSDLEAGLINASSVPDRLTRALGELLQTTAEQVRAALDAQSAVRPALQLNRSSDGDVLMRDFADAVRLSTSMSPEQKTEWLTI